MHFHPSVAQQAPGSTRVFAAQSRLPRAGRIARAYGTENVRPAAVVNRVTITSLSPCLLSSYSVAPTRISLSGSSVHWSISRACCVLNTAASRKTTSPPTNCSSDGAVAVRSSITIVGIARERARDTRRISTSRGSSCSIAEHTFAPGGAPNGTNHPGTRLLSLAKNIPTATSTLLKLGNCSPCVCPSSRDPTRGSFQTGATAGSLWQVRTSSPPRVIAHRLPAQSSPNLGWNHAQQSDGRARVGISDKRSKQDQAHVTFCTL